MEPAFPGENSSRNLMLSLPVWIPGSYLIREFSGKVDNARAKDNTGKSLAVKKLNKNTWEIFTNDAAQFCIFNYRVYCNEFTVRTSEVNEDHAFINGANVFMSIEGVKDTKCELKIIPYPGWNKISTGLNPSGKENTYLVESYDELIDSPIEIGNQTILEFEIQNIPHRICLYSKGNYDEKKLTEDFKKITEAQLKFFNDIPYKHYTYIVHLVESGGGGLEHLNSFVVQSGRWIFDDDKKYLNFLRLVSHEFFHVWNVKRVTPAELGPFNYNKENYTKSLWVAEGWTSFFDDYFIYKCGLSSKEEYYESIAKDINEVIPYSGRFHQSLEESSYDTWIKFYRQNENSRNDQISYYTKGSLAAMLLNIIIIRSSDAKHSLADVMKELYSRYRSDPSKGYSPSDIKEVCESFAGIELSDFWQKYISGKEDLPLKEHLEDSGLKLININESSTESSLDIELAPGSAVIAKVFAPGSAYEAGLNSNDEIIALNNIRINGKEKLDKIIRQYKTGEVVKILINRKELIREFEVQLLQSLPKFEVKEIEKLSDSQKQILAKWLTM
jgi:predicted metalloprotease with PDZ domain